jgi:hypothetical protein
MDTSFNRIHRGVSTKYLPPYLTMLATRYAEKLDPKDALHRIMRTPLVSQP